MHHFLKHFHPLCFLFGLGVILIQVISIPALAQPQSEPCLNVRVLDPLSQPVEGATVTVGGKQQTTNSQGIATLCNLGDPPHSITVSAVDFELYEGSVPQSTGTFTLSLELPVETQELVVTGSRAQPRSVTESQVPIDAIPAQDIMSMGVPELDYKLRTLIPSINVATQPISDSATFVRPIQLRNLAHDQTLILINGKRRHRSSVLAWFGGTNDGYHGVDILTIPSIALRQVEVLRDGASAQYGSDAIAGVINFDLKDDPHGGSIEFNTGMYGEGDGESYSFAGNAGVPLGDTGFANFSLEYGNSNPTDRSVQRLDAAALIEAGNTHVANPAHVWGNPRVEDDLKLFGNFGNTWENGTQFYAFTNYAERKVTGGFYFRNPNTRGNVFSNDDGETLLIGDVLQARGMGSANCPTVRVVDNVPDPDALQQVFDDPNCFSFQEIAPGGFTPNFGAEIAEAAVLAGIRRVSANGLTWDASASYGSHKSDFFMLNTVNASLGPDTPRDFEAGSYTQEEVALNFDVSRALSDVVNLAGGTEWRNEIFTTGAGERASWEVGPFAPQGFSPASNGFPGFADFTVGSWDRGSVAAYGDVELRSTDDRFVAGGAVRFEHYESFGSTTNGKLSTRIGLSDAVALRAAVSTGFRAPTAGQQNAINVQTLLEQGTLKLVDNGTVPSTFAAAQRHGGVALRPETSRNLTAGLVVDNGPFTFTADYFRVAIEDRLALSGDIETDEEDRELLVSDGLTSAESLTLFRFFVNDLSTINQGIDIVSTYTPAALQGDTVLSFMMNYTKTEVTKVPASFWEGDVVAIERGTPNTRFTAALNQRILRASLLSRLSYYGPYIDVLDARWYFGDEAEPLSGKPILDLELSIPLTNSLTLALGAQNVFNTYSDILPHWRDDFGAPYSQFTPWGFSGGYYYTRLAYRWGQ